MTQYSELIRKLYKVSLYHPTKVGLTSMMNIYKMIGKPLDHIPVVSISMNVFHSVVNNVRLCYGTCSMIAL